MHSPLALNGINQCVYIFIDVDVDAMCDRAREAGAGIVTEPYATHYGSRDSPVATWKVISGASVPMRVNRSVRDVATCASMPVWYPVGSNFNPSAELDLKYGPSGERHLRKEGQTAPPSPPAPSARSNASIGSKRMQRSSAASQAT